MDREDNVRIFKDTMYQIKKDSFLSSAVSSGLRNGRVILEREDYVPRSGVFYGSKVEIKVSGKRTLEAASAYRGQSTAVLNFASAVRPGGGVRGGSFAQEESICRTSTLYPCLDTEENWNKFYTPHRSTNDRSNTDDTIYTPDVVVFKEDRLYPVMMDRKDWYKVNVITTAAPDLTWPDYPGEKGYINPTEEELTALHEKRAKRILSIACGEGNECVILGAFGCGAFHNPPHIVAEAYRKVIEENFLYKFRVIEFAVYTNPYKGETENLREFRRVFSS